MLVTGMYTGRQFNLSLTALNNQRMWRSHPNSGLLHALKNCHFSPRDRHMTRSLFTLGTRTEFNARWLRSHLHSQFGLGRCEFNAH